MAAPLQLRQFQRIFRQFKKKSLCRAFSVTSSLSNKPSTEEKTTHFGFQTVTEEEKEKEGSISIKFLTSLSFDQKLLQGSTVGSVPGSGAREGSKHKLYRFGSGSRLKTSVQDVLAQATGYSLRFGSPRNTFVGWLGPLFYSIYFG